MWLAAASLPYFWHVGLPAPEVLEKKRRMASKSVSWAVAEEENVGAVYAYLFYARNGRSGLDGTVSVGDTDDRQERVSVDLDDLVLVVPLLLLLLLLLHVLNRVLCSGGAAADAGVDDEDEDDDDSFEDPDSDPCAFSVPAFNGGHFYLKAGGCSFTILPNIFLLLVQSLPQL